MHHGRMSLGAAPVAALMTILAGSGSAAAEGAPSVAFGPTARVYNAPAAKVAPKVVQPTGEPTPRAATTKIGAAGAAPRAQPAAPRIQPAAMSGAAPVPSAAAAPAHARNRLPACDPTKDLSCTVVRETTEGTVVMTVVFHKGNALPVVWSPHHKGAVPPAAEGTVCIAPSNANVNSFSAMLANPLPNDAPILD